MKTYTCVALLLFAAVGLEAVQGLSKSDREDIIDAAIAESKQYYERQEAQMAMAENFYTSPNSAISPERLFLASKMPSEKAKKHAKARLLYEDMVRRAERKLSAQMGKLSITNMEDKAEAIAQNLFHVPGSLLTAEELVKIFGFSGCRPLLLTPNCTFPTINLYRTADGTCNNIAKPTQGAAGTAFRRILPAHYEDGISTIRGEIQNYGNILPIGPFAPPNPSARLVSQTIVLDKPVDELQATHMLMQWGQFLDHDITLSPSVAATCVGCQNTEICLPIFVPSDDPVFGVGTFRNGSCIAFRRTVPACTNPPAGTFDPRQQINDLTQYIDGSMVYGSDPTTATSLRDTSGGGRLRVGFTLPGNSKPSLPLNAAGTGFVAGDTRVNEQPGLMSIQTIFMREHNRVAAALASVNPTWSNERLYQEARKIVGAEIQKITYSEFLPTIMGSDVFNNLIGPYLGYNPNADASIPNEFGTAAYRVGHSLIRPNFPRLQADYVTPIVGGDQALIFSGTNSSTAFSPPKLFEGAAPGSGSDLASLNIQRWRDHGLPPYTIVKNFCKNFYGVSSGFEHQLTFIRLLQTYGSLDTADLWVGGLSEERLPNSVLGATFACIFANTFANLRDGDRFFYQAPGVFTPQQVAEINKASLSRIICDNSDGITQIQPSAFLGNQSRVSCCNLPAPDLSQWKEPICRMGVSVSSILTRVNSYTVTSLFPVPNSVTLPPGTSFGCVQIPCPTPDTPANVVLFTQGSFSITVNPALPINTASPVLSSSVYSAAIPSTLVDNPVSGIFSTTTCSNSTFPAVTFTVLTAESESSVSKSDEPNCNDLDPNASCTKLSLDLLNLLNSLTSAPSPTPNNVAPSVQQLDLSASKDALLKELEEDLQSLVSKDN
ncbi:hypothetical protein EMCRGX_G011405 [Ephydatia muelleri]